MDPFYTDNWLTVWAGDCRDVMAQMPAESVQMVCTSPPYYGLRDYGIEPSVWGGEAHEHEWGAQIVAHAATYEAGEKARWNHRQNGRGEVQDRILEKDASDVGWTRKDAAQGSFCPCGAWLGVLGLEPTLEMYVAHMTEVFRGVRRVLRSDGCVWLNLGDSYNAYNGGAGPGSKLSKNQTEQRPRLSSGFGLQEKALKPKDRMMIPARVAIALQADGWWLRDEIVWHKPNPMPSSVTDRTTPAHEMVYLLTKSARYFYDAEAIKESATYSGPNGAQLSPYGQGFTRRSAALSFDRATKEADVPGQTSRQHRPGRDAKQAQIAAHAHGATERTMGGFNDRWDASEDAGSAPLTRNKRSVWTIPTAPYPASHFATFPPKLIEPMILAGTSARGCCPECGAPWERETERVIPVDPGRGESKLRDAAGLSPAAASTAKRQLGQAYQDQLNANPPQTTGWAPTCKCRHDICVEEVLPAGICTNHHPDPVPCTVLDPFGGSGTVGQVAQMHSRRAVLIDMNPEYLAQQMQRCAQSPLGLDVA